MLPRAMPCSVICRAPFTLLRRKIGDIAVGGIPFRASLVLNGASGPENSSKTRWNHAESMFDLPRLRTRKSQDLVGQLTTQKDRRKA